MKIKRFIILLSCLALLLPGCRQLPETETGSGAAEEIVILHTNDTHSQINNYIENDDGTKTRGLSFASVAAMKNEIEENGGNVILVDVGDHMQGSAFGSLDEGETMVQLMNQAGYDCATLGNHEFDYGMDRVLSLPSEARYPYVSCNFVNAEDSSPVVEPYTVIEKGGVRVAFVGIATPKTLSSSPYGTFFDETKSKFKYDIVGRDGGESLYKNVQQYIDEAREESDYVIGLGHLGIEEECIPFRSTDVIANTSGFDLFIDGHSHSVINGNIVMDADGNGVPLVQTGKYFENIGKITISGGEITTELISDYDKRDESTAALEDKWISDVNEKLGETIAVSDISLCTFNPKNPDERLVRKQGCNMGDFVADAFYYMTGMESGISCDVAIINGGNMRADIVKGDVTLNDCLNVLPFMNTVCVKKMTGQTLLDALEFGVRKLDAANNVESPSFLHVAGMKYEVDLSIPSTVKETSDGVWEAAPDGEYRVKNVMIYNKSTGSYDKLDEEKLYTVVGDDYILTDMGDGYAMFSGAEMLFEGTKTSDAVMSEYIRCFKSDNGNLPHISTKNSPLAEYKGYLFDYENAGGSGRIKGIPYDPA